MQAGLLRRPSEPARVPDGPPGGLSGGGQNGTMSSHYFHYFPPGQRMLAVEDMWGQVVYGSFRVTSSQPSERSFRNTALGFTFGHRGARPKAANLPPVQEPKAAVGKNARTRDADLTISCELSGLMLNIWLIFNERGNHM